jgi:dihydroflavonol-4-reductase
MKILVTGATGFVGSVLVPELIHQFGGADISAYVLPGESLPKTWKNQSVRVFWGDITDRARLMNACRGQSHVIHLAGHISYWRRDFDRLMEVNREGARSVVEAGLTSGIQRLIHVSSVGAIGFKKNGVLVDEETPFNWPPAFHYMTSKFLGQRIVERAARRNGLPAVVLNPASIMGPGDHNPRTPHNRLYQGVYEGRLFGSFGGGLGVVDVRDVVAVIIKALTAGRIGEQYLLVGANLSYSEVLKLIGRFARRPVYPFPVPAVLLAGAGVALETFSYLTGKRPFLTYSYGRLSGWRTYYSNEKSRRDFSHSYIPIEKTIADTCLFYEKSFLHRD